MTSTVNTTEKKGILDQARDYIHQTVQSDKDRETIQEGEKSSVTRAFEKLTVTCDDKDTSKDDKKGFFGGAVEGTRKAIYNATKTDDEKKLEEDAKKTITEKAAAEVQDVATKVDDGLHYVLLPIEGKNYEQWKAGKSTGKDDVQEAVETAKEKVDETKEKAKSTTKDIVEETKETGANILDQAGQAADKVDDALHATVLPIEGKDYDAWKQAKEQNREQSSPESGDEEKPKDFIDKAKDKVGSLFSSKKEDAKEISQ